MKKLLSIAFLTLAVGVNAQQLPNVGFENWKSTCGKTLQATDKSEKLRPGIEPSDWNGTNVNQSVANITASESNLITKQNRGTETNPNYYVKLANRFVGKKVVFSWIGATAPAYLTFGTPWSYPATSSSDQDGGTFGGTAFTYRPDAIKGKFKRTNIEGKTENAHIITYFWTGTFTSMIGKNGSPTIEKSDVDRAIMAKSNAGTIKGDGKLIASCDYEFATTTDNDWQEIVVPIEYKDLTTVPEKMNVIISSADYWTRENIQSTSNGVDGSILEVDDVEFVYYHTLDSIYYNGVKLSSNLVEGSTIECCTENAFDENKLNLYVKGVGATTSTSFDSSTGILIITVKGNDFDSNSSSKSVYKVKFVNPTYETFTNSLFINAYDLGGKTFDAVKDIKVLTYNLSSGVRKDLLLEDFVFAGAINVGNILVDNTTVSTEGTKTILTAQYKPVPVDLSSMEVGVIPLPLTLRAEIEGSTMTSTIRIYMNEDLNENEVINVVFAPAVTMDGSAAITATGLTNVKVARSFKQGWNTLALPFAITTDDLGTGVKAQEFTGVTADGSGLNFTAVTSLEANKPYLVYFPAATDVADYFGTNISAVNETGVTHGAYTFKPNFSNPSLSMAGNYGVVTADGVSKIMKGGAGSTLQTIRAYFTGKGAETARIYFDGETTGIDNITNAPANGKIYNLQGVEVSGKLPAGVYVKNGEKVIIK